jgi:hypothetical protein
LSVDFGSCIRNCLVEPVDFVLDLGQSVGGPLVVSCQRWVGEDGLHIFSLERKVCDSSGRFGPGLLGGSLFCSHSGGFFSLPLGFVEFLESNLLLIDISGDFGLLNNEFSHVFLCSGQCCV